MANLRNFRGKWYARSRWVDNGNKIEKLVPLRTSSKVTARERIAEVNKVEDDIKQGMEFSFSWLSNSTMTKIKRFTLRDAVNQWMSKRVGKLAEKTIELNQNSLNYFLKFIGNTYPLESITTNQLEQFSDCLLYTSPSPRDQA